MRLLMNPFAYMKRKLIRCCKMIIKESNMKFGNYDPDNVFHIEKSDIYTKLKDKQSVKTTEFILLRNNQILFVEAKTSTPNSQTYQDSEEKTKKYHAFVNDIVQKFSDSIEIYSSLLLNYIHSSDFPPNFKVAHNSEITSIEMIFILVIKNAFPSSLEHYKQKLERELKTKMKIWGIKNILVIDETQAKRKNLII
jgi:hypothetical protein